MGRCGQSRVGEADWVPNPVLPGQPRPEIAEIWDNLQLLKDVRNYIHLPKAAGNDAAHWREILAREQEIVAACEAVTDRLRDLSHVFRD